MLNYNFECLLTFSTLSRTLLALMLLELQRGALLEKCLQSLSLSPLFANDKVRNSLEKNARNSSFVTVV